ncbi:hypothetical protein EVAR_57760_1 [Eumeta japonica]|uniref:Uncharacterized protein n=1 Tax=Eumeta variegata TaxID=151549 RepID=A0A4C1Y6L4_EUMVA|nr:hypothetical protein EVAR_57760_1 [Eumeta japonica]
MGKKYQLKERIIVAGHGNGSDNGNDKGNGDGNGDGKGHDNDDADDYDDDLDSQFRIDSSSAQHHRRGRGAHFQLEPVWICTVPYTESSA